MSAGYGVGAIYQRKSDNRWVAAVEMPRRRGEPRARRTFSGVTREAVEAKLAAYREENPAPEFLGPKAYYERARAQGRPHTADEWRALVRRRGGVCAYCHVKTTASNIEKDHIIPVSRGGSDSIDNIAVSCHDCNADKNSMDANEYISWKMRRP